MDPQRVLNYSESRKVEEGALAPRKKFVMTKEQMAGFSNEYRTLNTNTKPILPYNHVDMHAPPFESGGPQINPGLSEISQNAQQHIQTTAATFDANQGANPGLQSGIAIERLQNKGNNTNYNYFSALEIPIWHTANILDKALPKIYDTQRQARILNSDGSNSMVNLNDSIHDEESGQMVEINNLSQGQYDVTCSAGPAVQSMQQESRTALMELAAIDPTILQQGGDILLNNIDAPGIGKLAERKRALMVAQGLIPEDQLTDEEKQMLQAQQAQQGQQEPSPVEQALIDQAQAEVEKAQANTQKILGDLNNNIAKNEIETNKLILKQQELQDKRDSEQQKQQIQMNESVLKALQAQDEQIKTQAETLKIIKDAMGVDTIVGPHNKQAYIQQAGHLADSQQGLQTNQE